MTSTDFLFKRKFARIFNILSSDNHRLLLFFWGGGWGREGREGVLKLLDETERKVDWFMTSILVESIVHQLRPNDSWIKVSDPLDGSIRISRSDMAIFLLTKMVASKRNGIPLKCFCSNKTVTTESYFRIHMNLHMFERSFTITSSVFFCSVQWSFR